MSEKTILLNLTEEDFEDQFDMLTARFTQLSEDEIDSAIERRKYREDIFLNSALEEVLDEFSVVYIHTVQESEEMLDYGIVDSDELLSLGSVYDDIELMWYVDATEDLCCDFIVDGQWEHYSFRVVSPRLDPYDAMITELSIISSSISRQEIETATVKVGRKILYQYDCRKRLRDMEMLNDNK